MWKVCGSLRRGCLNHTLIFRGKYLKRIVDDYITYFNQEQSHQGIGQRLPDHFDLRKSNLTGGIMSKAFLVGLLHGYSRATYLNYPASFGIKPSGSIAEQGLLDCSNHLVSNSSRSYSRAWKAYFPNNNCSLASLFMEKPKVWQHSLLTPTIASGWEK